MIGAVKVSTVNLLETVKYSVVGLYCVVSISPKFGELKLSEKRESGSYLTEDWERHGRGETADDNAGIASLSWLHAKEWR